MYLQVGYSGTSMDSRAADGDAHLEKWTETSSSAEKLARSRNVVVRGLVCL